MIYRHEIKYLLSVPEHLRLKSVISGLLETDGHVDADGGYSLKSLYFDDVKNTDFFTKLAGLEERKKYRIRLYNSDTSFIRMEKKVKINDVSYKLSAPIDLDMAMSAAMGRIEPMRSSKHSLLREIFLYDRHYVLRPCVITSYRREPFIYRPGNVRITFDYDLRAMLDPMDLFNPEAVGIPAIAPGQRILEVKYDGFLPSFIQKALSNSNAQLMAISKFALCRRFKQLNDWEVM